MRRITIAGMGVAIVAALTGCGGLDCDVEAGVAELAGPGATDCGSVDGNLVESTTPEDARTCALAALEQGDAFFVTASPPSADGGTVRGYASDGGRLYYVRYDYILPMFGGDSETYQANTCVAISDDGGDCRRLYETLCLRCEEVAAIGDACPSF